MNIDFIVWVIISYCFIYFVAQIVPVLATGRALVVLFLFVIPSSLQGVLKYFLNFLGLKDASGSSCKSSAPVLESSFL